MTDNNIDLPGRIFFRANIEADSYSLCDLKANKWVLALHMNGEMTTAKQAALAERMTACWNACEGVPTAVLDDVNSSERELLHHYVSVLTQRDQLLEALHKCSEQLTQLGYSANHADQAIAKVKLAP